MKAESTGLRFILLAAALTAAGAGLGGVLVLCGASFANPRWLHLAWLSPGLLVLDAYGAWARDRGRQALGDPVAVDRLVQGRQPGIRAVKNLLAALAVLLFAVAAARPQWGMTQDVMKRRGVDVFVCVDTSKSMLAQDQKPNRLERAKLAVGSLLDRLVDDRVGLIAFAGEARLVCPLTLDRSAADLFLDTLEVDMLQRPGTALAPALRLALRCLQASSDRQGVVVLITDGEDHEGGVDEAAKELAANGVVVHCVGIGQPEGAPVPLPGGEGGQAALVKDADGNIVMSRLDVATLRQIADATGGSFQAATGSEMELTSIAAAIGRMTQQDLASRRTQVRTDRYAWFLALGLFLLALETFLPDGARLLARAGDARTTRLAALRTAEGKRQRQGLVAMLVGVVLGLGALAGHARAQSAPPASQLIPPGGPVPGGQALPAGPPPAPSGPPELTLRKDTQGRTRNREVARDAARAKQALLEGRAADARKDWEAAQVLDPDRPELQYDLGLASLVQGDLDAAAAALGSVSAAPQAAAGAKPAKPGAAPAGGPKAVAPVVDPRLAEDSLYDLAHVAVRKDDLKGAVSRLARVVSGNPGAADARRNLELALRLMQSQEQQKKQQQQQQKQDQQQQQQQKQQDQQQAQDQQPKPQEQQPKAGEPQPQGQQPQPQPGELTKQQAEDLLAALAQDEKQDLADKQARERMRLLPAAGGKDW